MDYFFSELWPGLTLWVLLYLSDGLLTIISARAHKARASENLVFEGGYELTPYFRGDVAALSWVSWRSVVALAVSSGLLSVLWWLSRGMRSWPQAYEFVLGSMVLVQITVHMRHFRNLFSFLTAFGPDGAKGRIEYPRRLLLRLSAFEVLEFAGLYLGFSLLIGSWFILGGAAGCALLSWNHWQWARRGL